MQQTDEVETILRILRNPATMRSDDKQLLLDLTDQYDLFCANYEAAESNMQEEICPRKSLSYLQGLAVGSTSSSSSLPYAQRLECPNEQANGNNVVETLESGRKQYYLNGKPIKFKVLKNKPKNGDFQRRWNQRFTSLKQYKNNFGNLLVTRATPGYEELGNWVAEQRRKLKKGRITLEQFEMLCDIGMWCDVLKLTGKALNGTDLIIFIIHTRNKR